MELVFTPLPLTSHLLPAVEVAKRILHRDQHISIFLLIIPEPNTTASSITDFIKSKSHDNNPYPTRLTLQTLPPLSNPPDPSSPNLFETYLDLQKPLIKKVIEEHIKVGSSRLGGFIFDMFYTTLMDVATHFKVPSFGFFVCGSSFLGLVLHLQSLADEQGVDIASEFNDLNAEFDLPGFVNRVSGNVIPPMLVDTVDGGSSAFLKMARNFRKSNGILVNTFKELQPCGVQALLDSVAKNALPPVYPVGPILELPDITQGETQKSIKEWLDDQPLSSVVFVCFGSLGGVDEDQVQEIAKGLENSGHRFIWSLRPPKGNYALAAKEDNFVDALPQLQGFVDRTRERGKIIGWAPQIMILAHPCVGGFVSHCGWNSILESLWFGVPIATWPQHADNPLNGFELVKELGLAVEIRNDYKYDMKTRKANFIVTAQEIEDGVNKLMGLDKATKDRAREISDQSRKTLEEGGSSYKSLGHFIEDVWNNFGR